MINKIKNKYLYILKDKHLNELFRWSFIAFFMKIFWIWLWLISSILISHYYWAKWMWTLSLTTQFIWILTMIWSLGLTISILRYIWEYKSENNFYKIKVLYKKLLEIVIPFSLIIIIIIYFFIDSIAIWFLKKEEMILPLKTSIFFVPLFILYWINIEFIRWLKKIKVYEFIRNIAKPFFNILLIILLTFIYTNELIPIYALLIVIIIIFLISSIYLFNKLNTLKKDYKKVENISKKKIIWISLPMMVTAFSFLIMWTIDSFMIWRFTDLSSVWIYSVALSIATLVTLILVSINTIVAPQFSELYWKKDIKNLKKVVYYSSKLIFITTIPLLIILITYSKFFMWLYGSEFISWYTVLSILVIWQFISATCWSVWYFLNMTWKQKVFRNVILIALILNIILNYLLIPTYWILWAAIATSISISFWNIVSAIYIKIKFNILTFYIPFYNKIWK